ncbi:hypothetical protein VTJ04DRAFT_8564 [Mycothermus thermophilus]|uniref:uncharacterized protein n=1 Tax=Humicola insolens TaxID=85995 RepID=UPI0037437E30
MWNPRLIFDSSVLVTESDKYTLHNKTVVFHSSSTQPDSIGFPRSSALVYIVDPDHTAGHLTESATIKHCSSLLTTRLDISSFFCLPVPWIRSTALFLVT